MLNNLELVEFVFMDSLYVFKNINDFIETK